MKTSFYKKAGWISGFLFANCLPFSLHAGDAVGTSAGTGQYTQPRFHTTISLNEGYDDNSQTSHDDKVASAYTAIQLNSFADLGNGRTAFTIGVGIGVTQYYNRPGDKFDKLASLNVSFAHKINERLTFSLGGYLTYQVQPDFTLLVAQNRVNGQYFYTGDTLSLSYQWSRRFQTVTSYQFVGIFYQDSLAKVTNDYVTHTFGNQFRFQMQPTTTLVAEYRLALVEYMYQTDRNTMTNFFLVGADHSFSPKFTVSMRVGGQMQSQKDSSDAASPYAEGTLSYAYQKRANVQAYMRYGFDYSNLGFGQNDRALRLGMQFNHGITPKLTFFLGCFYQHDDYSATPGSATAGYTQDTFSISTGVRYAVTPRLTLSAGYTRTQLISDNTVQEYDRNIVTFGGSYSF